MVTPSNSNLKFSQFQFQQESLFPAIPQKVKILISLEWLRLCAQFCSQQYSIFSLTKLGSYDTLGTRDRPSSTFISKLYEMIMAEEYFLKKNIFPEEGEMDARKHKQQMSILTVRYWKILYMYQCINLEKSLMHTLELYIWSCYLMKSLNKCLWYSQLIQKFTEYVGCLNYDSKMTLTC